MGSFVFSAPASRATDALNWLAPAQAVFAFFAQPQVKPHAVPNQRTEYLHQPVPAASKAVRRIDQPDSRSEPLPALRALHVHACSRSSLKILREFEPGKSRSSTGRLVISGRIADVCEVLDRMAARSGAAH